jgi:ArsR family transcriptional regulator
MNDTALSKIFKALSNEQRLRIFRQLCEWQDAKAAKQTADACCGVEKGFTRTCCSSELSPSTVSHHFKELQSAGLITAERTGQSFVCTVNVETLDAVRSFLKVAPRK